ncbi:MAG: hypothetical protein F4X40_02185 [Chloroflexi bacterium]|nr:hypothetical protein [Chloroflexota bacterium]
MSFKQRRGSGGLTVDRNGGTSLKVHSKGKYGEIRYVKAGDLTNSSNFRSVIVGLTKELKRKRDQRRRDLVQERRRVRLDERPPARRRSTESSH